MINEQSKVLNSLQQPPIAAVSPTKSRETAFEGIMIDSIELIPKNELEIITKLIASYSAAKEQQPFAARPYLLGLSGRSFWIRDGKFTATQSRETM